MSVGVHLLVVVSPHGFGHAAQTAPVVNALRRRRPDLQLTLRTTVPRSLLAMRFHGEFRLLAEQVDFGMRMASAIDVLPEASARAYTMLHRHWDEQVAREAARLRALAPSLVLCNVPYLTLAGAAAAAIPACAVGSLNWADIYRHYLATKPDAARIHSEMRAAYASAKYFLQTQPHMPMTDLPNRRSIGPVAQVGRERRAELQAKLGVPGHVRIVNIAPGGMELRLPLERWRSMTDICWIVPRSWKLTRPDVFAFEGLDMPFVDVLRSCDALIGKPGYGSFVEAACNAVPVLFVRRHDWPEEPYLIDWLRRNGRCREIERRRLEDGDVVAELEALWDQPACPPVLPTGIDEAVSYLVDLC